MDSRVVLQVGLLNIWYSQSTCRLRCAQCGGKLRERLGDKEEQRRRERANSSDCISQRKIIFGEWKMTTAYELMHGVEVACSAMQKDIE